MKFDWKFWGICAMAFVLWKVFFAVVNPKPHTATPPASVSAPDQQAEVSPAERQAAFVASTAKPVGGGWNPADKPAELDQFGGVIIARMPAASSLDNFATCVLDKMPGAANSSTQGAVLRSCRGDHLGSLAAIVKGSGRRFLSFDNADECIIKKTRDTTYGPAAGSISMACQCLYAAPAYQDQRCDE